MPPRSRRTSTPAASTSAGTGDATNAQTQEGFEVGQTAPSDKYAPVGPDGAPDLKKITTTAPKGMGVQLVRKGDTVTQAVYDQLNPQADAGVAQATPVGEPQGPGQRQLTRSDQ